MFVVGDAVFAAMNPGLEFCEVCETPVQTMTFKNTGFCSNSCMEIGHWEEVLLETD